MSLQSIVGNFVGADKTFNLAGVLNAVIPSIMGGQGGVNVQQKTQPTTSTTQKAMTILGLPLIIVIPGGIIILYVLSLLLSPKRRKK